MAGGFQLLADERLLLVIFEAPQRFEDVGIAPQVGL